MAGVVTVLNAGAPSAPPAGMAAYLDALDRGQSVLVRPRSAYAGFPDALARVAGLVAGRLLVTDLAEAATDAPGQAGGAAPAVVAYHTSGTTGLPKCVVYRQRTVREHALLIADSLGLRAGGRYASLTPPNFAYGLSIVNSHALSGVPVSFAREPSELEAAYGGTRDPLTVYLLPQQASLLATGDAELPLERVITAGGRVSRATVDSLLGRYPDLRLTAMYGQAELGPRLALWDGPLRDFVPGTLGDPIGDVRFRLGQPDGDGRTELLVTTPHAMSWTVPPPYDGVLPGPSATDEVATGDHAERLASGQYRHTGRREDIANVAGTKLLLTDLAASIEARLPVTALRVSKRRARLSGDDVPVVEMVPAGRDALSVSQVRRVLHDVWGPLVALLDIRIVDQLTMSEAGK